MIMRFHLRLEVSYLLLISPLHLCLDNFHSLQALLVRLCHEGRHLFLVLLDSIVFAASHCCVECYAAPLWRPLLLLH